MVLLVVDTQKLITNTSLYNFSIFVSNVKKMIKAARKNKVEVIYIRHDDGTGQELTKGTDGLLQRLYVPKTMMNCFTGWGQGCPLYPNIHRLSRKNELISGLYKRVINGFSGYAVKNFSAKRLS